MIQKTFHNMSELSDTINNISREATKNTLDKMLDKLGEFIYDDVYNTYEPKWYNRTEYLGDNYTNMWETYLWNNFGKGVGGAIKLKDDIYFPTNPTIFVHGSGNWRTGDIYSTLNLYSYLQIMNDPNSITESPFHFPTNNIMQKRPFWDDFERWADENYTKIFEEEFNNIINSK